MSKILEYFLQGTLHFFERPTREKQEKYKLSNTRDAQREISEGSGTEQFELASKQINAFIIVGLNTNPNAILLLQSKFSWITDDYLDY